MKGIKNTMLLSNIRVLLVEDEEFAREELSKFLRRRVGKLYTAKNGQEGLDTYLKNTPDLIVTDLKMPKINGLEMIRRIRELGHKPSTIIISAMSDSETILQAVDIGIVKYVVKPVNTEDLIYNMEQISSEILSHKLKETVINDSIFIDKDKKKELEQKVRGDIAHFLKSFTGKGPQNVSVFIQGNTINVESKGVLTLLESSLISKNRNHSLVDYNRRLLYLENKDHIKESLEQLIGGKINLLDVKCDCRKNVDMLTFSL